jgi:methionyl-tRNA formyltransferase
MSQVFLFLQTMDNNKSIIFFGTPEFAAEQLKNTIESGFDVVAVVTAPDKPAGRGKKLQQSAVKLMATKYNLPIYQPEKLKDETFIKSLESYQAVVFIVIAFRMLPEKVWQIPRLGTFNLHASLLPNYRGAAPINRAIMNGETKTGLTTFFIDDKIDEGNIIQQVSMDIGANESAGELHDRMIEKGKMLLIDTLNVIFDKSVQTQKQTEFKTTDFSHKTAPKIFKNDCQIDWYRPIIDIFNQIRGLSPYPAAFSSFISMQDQRLDLKIFETQIEFGLPKEPFLSVVTDNKIFLKIVLPDGYLHLKKIQQSGKKSLDIIEFLRGFQFLGIWKVSLENKQKES